MADQQIEPLAGDDAARLADFARACRAAIRAVALYPPEHAAIGAALARLADACARGLRGSPWTLDVSPDNLLLGGKGLARPDPAVGELADLLHAHYIGQIVIQGGADSNLWLTFLHLVGRPVDELRRQGGIARVWATTGGGPIELREIDYGSVLRERPGGNEASWATIVQNCLQGNAIDLDASGLEMLAEIVGDPDRLIELSRRLEAQCQAIGGSASAASLLVSMLKKVIESVMQTDPARVGPLLDSAADAAATQLPPAVMLELLSARGRAASGGTAGTDVPGRIVARLAEVKVAAFIARWASTSKGATRRLAEAFGALVPQGDRRARVLGLARDQAARFAGNSADLAEVWQGIEHLLTSYEDSAFVSEAYEQDLATARATAERKDRITDDPPDRIAGWLATVSDTAVRAADLQLLLDLVGIETDSDAWRQIAEVVTRHLDDLLLIGDFAAADNLVLALGETAADSTQPGRQAAAANAIEQVIAGQALAHTVPHLQSIDDDDFARVKRICMSLGSGVIGPLAEMLAVQEQPRVRERLTDLLLAFGALGRQCAEQLKTSANASVRRVAIYLLREFGGSDALPDLESLVDDSEPHVQRDALRAILKIGTDEAYSVLARALRSGTARSRDAILRQLDTAGDERAAPLFAYIVRSGDYQKAMRPVYAKAIGALGRLGGDEAVEVLNDGLYRGEWWAPARTAELRVAAARALARIGTPRARDVLETAARSGSRGVRRAAAQGLAASHAPGRGMGVGR